MWVARNRLGDLRIFEFPPRRFHSGSCLSSEDTGFNDEVYIGNGKDDTYSFWAIQKYYESDVIDDHASYGLSLYESSHEKDIICKQYEPSWAKDLKWEDEPIEIELVPKMMNAVQEKLAESVDDYFNYVGHVQDIHPYSKEQEQNYYNDMCWRWQDWNAIKYDHPSTWDLNFEDYVGDKR